MTRPTHIMFAATCFALMAPASICRAENASLTISQMFDLADRLKQMGHNKDAEVVYRTLSRDPDMEVRAEARFRLGMMLAEEKRYTDAALAFRALIDEKPRATRARLELARVLALMGDEKAARKELRQTQAIGLPPEVAIAVDAFASSLRSRKMIGGSIELAVAPDSNINRATKNATLDTVIAPLTLSQDARAQSGVGLKASGQIYARLKLANNLTFIPKVIGLADIYRRSQFNDISEVIEGDVEVKSGRDLIYPSISYGWRQYGGRPYLLTAATGARWLHPVGKKAQIELNASFTKADYLLNEYQSGMIYDVGATCERALAPRTGISLTVATARQTAHDPIFSTYSVGSSLLLWRDIGETTIFSTALYRHLEADEKQFLFKSRRKENYFRIGFGGIFRHVQIAGFSPVIRMAWERNNSTIGIYDHGRFSTDIGITRAF